MGVTAVLAQAAEPSLGGWYVGIAIGVVVVLVVVVVVWLIIDAARTIRTQAALAAEALDRAHDHTRPLWDVARTNRTTHAILEGAVRAREAVERA